MRSIVMLDEQGGKIILDMKICICNAINNN